jgi:hypothetical protein
LKKIEIKTEFRKIEKGKENQKMNKRPRGSHSAHS